MGASQIILTLRDKRSELADAINRLERQADQHRADLAHITATMRLFDPNVAPVPETLQTGDTARAQRLVSSRRMPATHP
jgi:hypothetical protein